MDKDQEKIIYELADKFIDLANDLSKKQRSGTIGVALRYAAARYSAFEASMQTKNLADEKEKHMQFFVRTFTEMLQKNFDEYGAMQARTRSE
jgi:hypothetical protein